MFVLHNQKGMNSPWPIHLGDIIFLFTWKGPLLIALIQPKAALLLGPQLIGSLCNYSWEQVWLHRGDVSALYH